VKSSGRGHADEALGAAGDLPDRVLCEIYELLARLCHELVGQALRTPCSQSDWSGPRSAPSRSRYASPQPIRYGHPSSEFGVKPLVQATHWNGNLQDVRVLTPGRASRMLAGERRAIVTALAVRYVNSRSRTSPLELYACNYEPEEQGERAREEPEILVPALTNRIRLAAHAVTPEICVGSNKASIW
jgi:hypothetical protein